MRDKVFRRVVSRTIVLRLFKGPSNLPGFCRAISTFVPISSGRCFSKTSLNLSSISLESSSGIESYPHAPLLLSFANAVSTYLASIGKSIDFGEPLNILTPCSTPS